MRVRPGALDHARAALGARSVEPVLRAPYVRGGGTSADAAAAHLLEELHTVCVELQGGRGDDCRGLLLADNRGEPLRDDAAHVTKVDAASLTLRGLLLLL